MQIIPRYRFFMLTTARIAQRCWVRRSHLTIVSPTRPCVLESSSMHGQLCEAYPLFSTKSRHGLLVVDQNELLDQWQKQNFKILFRLSRFTITSLFSCSESYNRFLFIDWSGFAQHPVAISPHPSPFAEPFIVSCIQSLSVLDELVLRYTFLTKLNHHFPERINSSLQPRLEDYMN